MENLGGQVRVNIQMGVRTLMCSETLHRHQDLVEAHTLAIRLVVSLAAKRTDALSLGFVALIMPNVSVSAVQSLH